MLHNVGTKNNEVIIHIFSTGNFLSLFNKIKAQLYIFLQEVDRVQDQIWKLACLFFLDYIKEIERRVCTCYFFLSLFALKSRHNENLGKYSYILP